jgi:predicted transcriptional regulator
MLDIAKDGALKTQIMYKANLSFSQLNTYLKLLIDTELLEIIERNRKRIYKTTKKGIEYMQSYKEVIDALSGNSNNNNGPRIKGGPTIYWIKKP